MLIFTVDTAALGWYNKVYTDSRRGKATELSRWDGKKTGDAFEILNGRAQRPGSRVKASLAALQWAAERAGKPCGIFTRHMTVEDETRIQQEYNEWRNAN